MWAATLCAWLPASAVAADSAPRPLNVLWICADDHAPYVIGAYGNQRVHTPHLDRLAAEGVRFDRAFCNSPVCTASRDSFITGRYPRTIGVTELGTPLPQSEATLAHVLKRAGYDTAAIGKMHFNSAHTYGFDLRRDLGYYDAHLAKRGKQAIPADIAVKPPWRPFRDPARIWLNADDLPSGLVDADMDATYFVDEAARFLAQPHAKPFFLIVSFYEPHSPFNFPVEYRGRFQPATFPVPPVGPEDGGQIPAVFRDLTPTDKQGIAAAYYTSVEFLDRKVGDVLQALDKSGESQHTLVLFTADHGYLLGQHGRFEKHCSYEEAIRAPLFMRCPGVIRSGGATSALVEFVDIFPTVLDLCGVKIPANVQGRSLVPLLKNDGQNQTHRREVFVEYAPNEEAAVRDERWKLVFERGKRRRADGYDTGLPLSGRTIRLYDLQSDPTEMHNVAAVPDNADRVKRMLASLAQHLRSTAREPALVPRTDDPLTVLDYCVQSHDVGARAAGLSGPNFAGGLRKPFLLAAVFSLAIVLASVAGAWLPAVTWLTHTRLQIVISLCGGLMLGVSLFHMLPRSVDVFGSLDRGVAWMLAGLLAMFFLIRAFHFHQHEVDRPRDQRPSWIGLALGLALSTLISGFALAASVEADANRNAWRLAFGTFAAIFLHQSLQATPLSMLAYGRGAVGGIKRFVSGSFAVLCPLGVALFFASLKQFPGHRTGIVGCGLAFSAGVFMCISLADLLPELEFHAHDRVTLSLALMAGVALGYAVV